MQNLLAHQFKGNSKNENDAKWNKGIICSLVIQCRSQDRATPRNCHSSLTTFYSSVIMFLMI